ncbi:MAG: hypothetical protein AAGJ46_03600 [Planctomycetota bacterium]
MPTSRRVLAAATLVAGVTLLLTELVSDRPTHAVSYQLAASNSPLASQPSGSLQVPAAVVRRLAREGIVAVPTPERDGFCVSYAGDDAERAHQATQAAFGLARFLRGRPIDDAELARRVYQAQQRLADLQHAAASAHSIRLEQRHLAALSGELQARAAGHRTPAPKPMVRRLHFSRRTANAPWWVGGLLIAAGVWLLAQGRSKQTAFAESANPRHADAVLAMPSRRLKVDRQLAA